MSADTWNEYEKLVLHKLDRQEKKLDATLDKLTQHETRITLLEQAEARRVWWQRATFSAAIGALLASAKSAFGV